MSGDTAGRGEWDELRTAGLLRRIEVGGSVFEEGDEAEGAYVLLSGRCVVTERGETVNFLTAGQLFGEIAGFGGGRRTATVTATEPSEVLLLSADQIQRRFADSPQLLAQVLQAIAARTRQIHGRQVAYREEHKALREVQRSLLPDLEPINALGKFVVQAAWEPCTYASGDYYDVIPIGGQRFLFAMGDVMGHGADASLTMAIARAQVRELARAFRRTDELLLSLDGYLRDNAPPRRGMSLAIAALDVASGVLEYSVAGHPPPMLLRQGAVSDLEGRPGILLAVPFLLGLGYERLETRLEPGDRLFFYTDGLFEGLSEVRGDPLGREGLARLFLDASAENPDDPLPEIMRRVREQDGAAGAADDRTALLLTLR